MYLLKQRTHTFEKSYDLNGKRKYKVTFPKFDNLENPKDKEININGEKFVWTNENKSHVFEGERITVKLDIDGNNNEYLGLVEVEEYTQMDNNDLEIIPEPGISDNKPETQNTKELEDLRE